MAFVTPSYAKVSKSMKHVYPPNRSRQMPAKFQNPNPASVKTAPEMMKFANQNIAPPVDVDAL
jgi:hypothetical protein